MKKFLLFCKCGALMSGFVLLLGAVSGGVFALNSILPTEFAQIDSVANVASVVVAQKGTVPTLMGQDNSLQIDVDDTTFSVGSENMVIDQPTIVLPSVPALPAGCVANVSTNKVLTISPTDNPTFTPAQKYACIKAKIERATKGQIVIFLAGVYPMSPDAATFGRRTAADVAIMVPSGVTIKGAGPTKTIFKLTNPKYALLFRMTPVRPGVTFSTTTLQKTALKGSSSIIVRNDQGPVAYFEMMQPNDVAYVTSLYAGSLIGRFGSLQAIPTIRTFHGKFTRQLVLSDGSVQYALETIVPISPGMMTVRNTIPHTFDTSTIVRNVPPVTNVTLQDFSIEGNFVGYPNTAVKNSDFSNVADMSLVLANSYAAILVDYANETVALKNIVVTYPWSRGVEIKRSVGTQLRYIKVSGAHNKGNGGNGYGITLSGTTNIDATDLVVLNTRHGFLFNAEDSEHFNFIKITDINRDINFHGLLDSGNVVSVGTMHQEYDANANATWAAVHFDQAKNHVPTVRADNTVYFSNVSASLVSFTGDPLRQNDRLVAAAGGAVMYGRLGNDVLVGNVRADSLYGGVGQDYVYGMGGNDILSGGDEPDTIDGGVGDDRIAGDRGADMLTGGPGADVFAYRRLAESVTGTADVITDFSVIEDRIDLTAAGYTKAKLQSSYDGTYTILNTKNFENIFELRLLGMVDFTKIMFVPLVGAEAAPQSFLGTIRQNLVAAAYRFLLPESKPADIVTQ